MEFQDEVSRIRNLAINSFSEPEAESIIIIPILISLGWDIQNKAEVKKQFITGVGRVDFGLLVDTEHRTLIEAKRPRENLEYYEWELLLYSFEIGAQMSVLTNGKEWRFYLPMAATHWTDRRFLSIDITSPDLQEVKRDFVRYLSKKSVASGEAMQAAQESFSNNNSSKVHLSRPVKKNRKFTPLGPTRAQTKMEIVRDALQSDWRTGAYLTWLTGQKGGWPAYVYDHYTSSSPDTFLLVKKEDGEAQLMRLISRSQLSLFSSEPDVQIYDDKERQKRRRKS